MIHHTILAIFLSCVAGITKKDYRNVAAFHIIHAFSPTYVSGNATYLKEVQIEIQIWICFLNLWISFFFDIQWHWIFLLKFRLLLWGWNH